MTTPARADDVLGALFLPFAIGNLTLTEDGRVSFLRARAGSWIGEWPHAQFSCEQTFKPFADELARAGMPIVESVELAAGSAPAPVATTTQSPALRCPRNTSSACGSSRCWISSRWVAT